MTDPVVKYAFYSVTPSLIHYDDSNQSDAEITFPEVQNLATSAVTGEPTLGAPVYLEKEIDFQSGFLVGTTAIALLALASSDSPYTSAILVVNHSDSATVTLTNGTNIVTIDPGMPCLLSWAKASAEPAWSISSDEENTPCTVLACGDWVTTGLGIH